MSTLKEVLDFQEWLTLRRALALRDKVGGQEGMEKIISDEYEITIVKKIRRLFDHIGRGIPTHLGVTTNARDEDHRFNVELPELSCENLCARIASFFPKGTEFAETSRFEDESTALKEKYSSHELIGNFFKRARPIIFPKHDARKNYGASLQDFILPAVKTAYKKQFPERKFKNYHDKELAGKVSIIRGTGHDELVSFMAEKSVVAWYSPNPFQGFSIFAQREAMKILIQYGFALAGGADTGIAVVAYTGEMARDFETPVYTCSALSWRSAAFSLDFNADGEEFGFGFGSTDYLDGANENSSGGLILFR